MRLVHFAAEPVTQIYAVAQVSRMRADKPAGFYLRSTVDVDGFTDEYAIDPGPQVYRIDWDAVAGTYQGIIITPYIWERRLGDSAWYYSWDCASGCIWDPAAIGSLRVFAGPVS